MRADPPKDKKKPILRRVLPFLEWFDNYSLGKLQADAFAGITVGMVLIPQSMAYAQLAGLPSYYGLFAAFLPPLIASLFGSSYQLATGPVAVVSLMTATALEPFATAGSAGYVAYALLLAFMAGAFQFLLGSLRLGMVVNFLSHPVINGFTNAAAIIIATSQLANLFGIDVDKAEHHYETVINVIEAAWQYSHWPTLVMALSSIAVMASLKRFAPRVPNVLLVVVLTSIVSWAVGFENNHRTTSAHIASSEARHLVLEFNEAVAEVEALSEKRVWLGTELQELEELHGEHSAEAITAHHELGLLNLEIQESKEQIRNTRASLRATHFEGVPDASGGISFYAAGQVPAGSLGDGLNWRLKVGDFALDEAALTFVGGGAVVGHIPEGLPSLQLPNFDFGMMLRLLPMVIIISLLGFMEAISIAKAMAAKTGQRLDPNRELIGQGLANMVGSIGQSYPVSGSFSRSAVNLSAGGVTGLSNVFSVLIVAVTLLFFTPLLYHLPKGVLASIIMMAVIGLVNVKGFLHAWQAQREDGVIVLVTFFSTLAFAPHLDRGIFIGVILSLALYLRHIMQPNIAMLSKYTDGSFRNARRFRLAECKHIALIRCNSPLFFANVSYLEDAILDRVASMPELRHVHIVGNGINEMDSSGEEMLSAMVDRIREAGYGMSVSGLNEEVTDVLRRTRLYEKIGADRIFGSVAVMVEKLYEKTHAGATETPCPLLRVAFRGMPVAGKATKSRADFKKGPPAPTKQG